MTSPNIAKALHRALRRDVSVRMWLEGAPVGGIPDQERYLLSQLVAEGAKVYFLGGDKNTLIFYLSFLRFAPLFQYTLLRLNVGTYNPQLFLCC